MMTAGYEVLVVVENKKTAWTGCEERNGVKYVVGGRFALKSILESVIDAWMPDFAILYGATSLRGFEPLVERKVPYVFFPRDWQEVASPAPYMDMLSRHPISAPGNIYHRLYTGAATVITNAKYVARVIRHLYSVEAVTSYVPVAPPENPDRYRSTGPILLINPRKMQGGQLVRKLARRLPHLHFRVVGEDGGPFPQNVAVEPFYNGPYDALYENTSLFLFPLIGEDPCGTGRVVFEALHCGIPSLSANIGGMGEVLPPDWLIDPDTVDEWCAAIERILADPSSHDRCQALLQAFDADAQMKILFSTFPVKPVGNSPAGDSGAEQAPKPAGRARGEGKGGRRRGSR
jgi:hypothetical protein